MIMIIVIIMIIIIIIITMLVMMMISTAINMWFQISLRNIGSHVWQCCWSMYLRLERPACIMFELEKFQSLLTDFLEAYLKRHR